MRAHIVPWLRITDRSELSALVDAIASSRDLRFFAEPARHTARKSCSVDTMRFALTDPGESTVTHQERVQR